MQALFSSHFELFWWLIHDFVSLIYMNNFFMAWIMPSTISIA